MKNDPHKLSRGGACGILVILFFLIYHGLFQFQKNPRYGQADYPVFYVAGSAILRKIDVTPAEIYTERNTIPYIRTFRPEDGGYRFLYPPPASVLLSPLAILPYSLSARVWVILNALSFVGSCYITLHLIKARPFDLKYSLFLLVLTFSSSVHEVIRTGNMNSAIWLLMMGGLLLLSRERWRESGFLWSAAALLKLFPAVFFLYFLLKRQWKVAMWFAVSGIFLLLVTFPFLGIQPYQEFREKRIHTLVEGEIGHLFRNFSLYGSILYHTDALNGDYFDEHRNEVLVYAKRAHFILSLILFVVLLFPLYRSRKDDSENGYVLDYSMIILFVLLVAKGMQNQYVIWTLPLLLYFLRLPLRLSTLPLYFVLIGSFLATQFWTLFASVPKQYLFIGFLRIETLGLTLLFVLSVLARLGKIPGMHRVDLETLKT